MSDKYIYKEEFVNESWGKMSALLDKEMPVKKKSVFPFWILFMLILLISGISAAFIYSSDKKGEGINIPEIPVADLNRTETNKEELIIPSKNNIINNKEENIAFIPKDKSENNIPINRNAKSYLIQENSINNETNNIQALNPFISDKDKLVSINNSFDNNIINPELSGNSYASLEKIESGKNDLIITPEVEEKESLASIDNIISKEKKWKFGFGAGMKLKSDAEKGFYVSADAKREISPRWNINTGAEYLNMRTTASYDPFTGNFIIPQSNLTQSNSTVFTDNQTNAKVRYHGLKIPILASYEMSPNWEIQMGIVTQLLFNNLKSTHNSGNSLTLEELNSLDKQLSKTEFLSFDPQVALGLAYHPTKHITAEIRYEQGLRNRVNENEYLSASSRYNRNFSGLHVGMKYYF